MTLQVLLEWLQRVHLLKSEPKYWFFFFFFEDVMCAEVEVQMEFSKK